MNVIPLGIFTAIHGMEPKNLPPIFAVDVDLG